MPILIELDAAQWQSTADLYGAVKTALGSPQWHGTSPAALVDSMVYGGINRVEGPYLIKVRGSSKCPAEVRDYLHLLADVIRQARADQFQRYGRETDVGFEINL
jgi:hypothetical protein